MGEEKDLDWVTHSDHRSHHRYFRWLTIYDHEFHVLSSKFDLQDLALTLFCASSIFLILKNL